MYKKGSMERLEREEEEMKYERHYELYLKPTKLYGDCVCLKNKDKLKSNDDISIFCGKVGDLVFIEDEQKMYIIKDKFIDKLVFENK